MLVDCDERHSCGVQDVCATISMRKFAQPLGRAASSDDAEASIAGGDGCVRSVNRALCPSSHKTIDLMISPAHRVIPAICGGEHQSFSRIVSFGVLCGAPLFRLIRTS
jgi:hypothetical protein